MGKIESLNWKLTFGEAIRRIWLRRNVWVFNGNCCDVANLYWTIIAASKDFEDSMVLLNFSSLTTRETRIKWIPPDPGWMKCNVDGACRRDGSEAGCGGVLRDSSGNWIFGFLLNLGGMDNLSAKLWGIWQGLVLIWERGF